MNPMTFGNMTLPKAGCPVAHWEWMSKNVSKFLDFFFSSNCYRSMDQVMTSYGCVINTRNAKGFEVRMKRVANEP